MSGKWQPFCLGLNVLTDWQHNKKDGLYIEIGSSL